MAVKENQISFVDKLFVLRPIEQRIILFLGDILFGTMALFCALLIWAMEDEWLGLSISFLQTRPPFWFYLLPLIWALLLVAFSENRPYEKWQKNMTSIFWSVLVSVLIYLSLYFLSAAPNALPRLGVVVFLTTASLSAFIWRYLFTRVFSSRRFVRHVLLVGYSETGLRLWNAISQDTRPNSLYCEGMILTGRSVPGRLPKDVALLGNFGSFLEVIREKTVHEVVLLTTEEMDDQVLHALLLAQGMGVRIVPVETMYEELSGRIPIGSLKSNTALWSILNQNSTLPFYALQKRLLDIIVGFAGVVVLALLFPVISLLSWIEAGSPLPLFQERVGLGGKIFRIIKFRTMYPNPKGKAQPLYTEKNDPRVTKFGRILRKMHLDEWAQFIHVLFGEMSVVGPRPEIKDLYETNRKGVPFYSVRLSVKPGITGWAQINYDYVTDLESTAIKLEYDLYYIKHRSILLDLLIMLKTIGTILGFKGQ